MMRSLMIFVFIFVMVDGAQAQEHYKINEQELEELRRDCGKKDSNRRQPSGMVPVKTQVTKNGNRVLTMYSIGVAISKRHLIVHARSLFWDWECHDSNVKMVVGNKTRYQVARQLCDVGSGPDGNCEYATPNRVFFRKAFDKPCKDEKNVGSRLHGTILIEMSPGNDELNTIPICLLPVTFNATNRTHDMYIFGLTTSGTIVTTNEDQSFITDCDHHNGTCVKKPAYIVGEVFVHKNRENRNFFIGYYPAKDEGEWIQGTDLIMMRYLLMSNNAELIYNFTRIPAWNYTADMFPQPTQLPPPIMPILSTTTSRITGSSTTTTTSSSIPPTSSTDATSSEIASPNEEMTKSEEFTFGEYDDDDLSDYRHAVKGGGVNGATWIWGIMIWWIIDFLN